MRRDYVISVLAKKSLSVKKNHNLGAMKLSVVFYDT